MNSWLLAVCGLQRPALALLERAETSANPVQQASADRQGETPLAMPTSEKHEEADPPHGKSGHEAYPVVPAGVLPHHLEEVSDAVVHALSPTGIGVRRAMMDQGGRDHENPESSSARAQWQKPA